MTTISSTRTPSTASPRPASRAAAARADSARAGTVTREQMASFLSRAAELAPSAIDAFTDDNGRTHEADINRLAAAGITQGCAAQRYCPTQLVRRDQMAAFLHRTILFLAAP